MSRAARLDQAMERAGFNLKELSSQCRVCRTSIYEFCQGSDVRLSVIERMATALNVSPAWLAWGLEVEKIAEGALVVRGNSLHLPRILKHHLRTRNHAPNIIDPGDCRRV